MPFGGLYGGLTLQTSVEPENGVFTNDVQTIGLSNAKKSFQHSGAGAAIRCIPVAGPPTTPVDGDFWYDLTINKFRHQEDGVVKNFGGDENAFVKDGNDFGEDALIGTTDGFSLVFIAGGLETARALPTQQFIVGATTAFGAEKMRVVGDVRLEGSVTITGDATVTGTTTTINTATLDVADRVIHVNHIDGVAPIPAFIAGFGVERGATAGPVARDHAALLWYGDSDVVDPSTGTGYWRFAVNTGGDDLTVGADLDLQARRYRVSASSGMGIRFETDNVASIGQAGNNRPSTIFAGTSVVVGNSVTISTSAVTGSGALGLLATGANPITLSTNGLERMQVTSAGNVYIGVPVNPDGIALQIFSAPTRPIILLSDRNAFGTGVKGDYQITAQRGDGLNESVAFWQGYLDGTAPWNGRMGLYTNNAGAAVEHIRLQSTGEILFKKNATEFARFLTTGQLIVGGQTLAGAEILSVQKHHNGNTDLRVYNSTDDTGAHVTISVQAVSGAMQMGTTAPAFTGGTLNNNNTGFLGTAGLTGGLVLYTDNATSIRFATSNAERMSVRSTGEVLIGQTSPSSLASQVDLLRSTAGIALGAVASHTGGTAAYFQNTSASSAGSVALFYSAGTATVNLRMLSLARNVGTIGHRSLIHFQGLHSGGSGASWAEMGVEVVDNGAGSPGFNVITRADFIFRAGNGGSNTHLDKIRLTGETIPAIQGTSGLVVRGGSSASAIIFQTAPATERMRILSTGEVGIGTSAPDVLLHVKLPTSGPTAVRIQGNGAGNGGYLIFSDGDGTTHAGTIGHAGPVLGSGTDLAILSFSTKTMKLVSGDASVHVRPLAAGNSALLIEGNGAGNCGQLAFVDGNLTTTHFLLATSGVAAGAGTDAALRANTGNGIRFLTDGNNERARITSSGSLFVGGYSTAAVSEVFGFRKDVDGITRMAVLNMAAGGTAQQASLLVAASSGAGLFAQMKAFGPAFTTAGQDIQGEVQFQASGSATGLAIRNLAAAPIRFLTTDAERVRILSTGEFLVGLQTTFSGALAAFERNAPSATGVFARNTDGGTTAQVAFAVNTGSGKWATLGRTGAGWTPTGGRNTDEAFLEASGGSLLIQTDSAQPIRISTNQAERIRITSVGEVFTGGSGYTTAFASERWGFRRDDNSTTRLNIVNGTSDTLATTLLTLFGGGTGVAAYLEAVSAGFTTVGEHRAGEVQLAADGAGATGLAIRAIGALPIRFLTTDVERARFLPTGELLVNTGALVGAEKLRVNGDVYIDGKLTLIGALDPNEILMSGTDPFMNTQADTTLHFKANGVTMIKISDTGVGLYGANPTAQAAASANLTDNSGGTASDTIADVPTLYDETYFQNTIASLVAKVNTLMNIVRNLGAMAT